MPMRAYGEPFLPDFVTRRHLRVPKLDELLRSHVALGGR